jgi:hypothetical protein
VSVDLLQRLQELRVFDPVPPRAGLGLQHVPFDDMTGQTTTEAALRRCIESVGRVAVTGGTGVGKSSVIAHVLQQLPGVAPIQVRVEAEDDSTVSEPAAFCAHLARTLVRQLRRAGEIDPAEETALLAGSAGSRVLARTSSARGALGLPGWMFRADVSRDVQTVVSATHVPSAAEHIERAQDIVRAVGAHGLVPVIVIDDSDSWLATGLGDRRRLIEPFFGRVVRVLAEEMDAALVLAVHNRYFEMPEFPRGRGFLDQLVTIPALPSVGALEAVLAIRIEVGAEDIALPDVMAPAAAFALFDAYRLLGSDLRRTLLVMHTALQSACGADAEHVGQHHIEGALAKYQEIPG